MLWSYRSCHEHKIFLSNAMQSVQSYTQPVTKCEHLFSLEWRLPNWWHVSVLTNHSFQILFFGWNGEGDAIQALGGEKGDLILRRKWRENNKGDIQRQRKEEGGMRHTKKADRKVTETKDHCRTCLKGSKVSDWLIVTGTIRFTL